MVSLLVMLKFVVFLLCGFCFTFFVPDPVLAGGLVPCGGIGQTACQTCDVVKLTNNVVEWLVIVMGTLAAIIIVYAGVQLVISGGNQAAMESAKSMMTNVIIGYVIILGAWLVIDYAMKALIDQPNFGVWNEVQCTTTNTPTDKGQTTLDYYEPIDEVLGGLQGWVPAGGLNGGSGTVAGGAPGSYNAACSLLPGPPGVREYNCTTQLAQCKSAGGTATLNATRSTVICTPSRSGGSSSGGSCTITTNTANACHPSKLTCFPDKNLASKICNLESGGGNANIMSGTDLCRDGSSFSVGLWQINILANRALIPSCSGTFFTSDNGGRSEGSCIKYVNNSKGKPYCQFRSCKITNRNIYNNCVAQAKIPANNTRAACSLVRTQGVENAWKTSYNSCR